jgi:kynurenine 3-monooxygenase
MDVSMSAKKVLIVGAGPAGLLAAHHLLLKGQPGAFDVTVAERRADPRESKQASKRSYSLGLGVRGRSSIKDVSASLWELVKTRGVECERFSLHLGRRVLQIRQTSPQLISEPSVLINRADLCAALLTKTSSLRRCRRPRSCSSANA